MQTPSTTAQGDAEGQQGADHQQGAVLEGEKHHQPHRQEAQARRPG